MPTETRMIDVSNNNGAVDWAKVAASGVQIGMAKATEGNYFHDRFLPANLKGMADNGMGRVIYDFARPSDTSALDEAKYFLDYVMPQMLPGDLLCLDLEDEKFTGNVGPWALDWLHYVESQVGFKPSVYTGKWYIDSRALRASPELGDFPLHIAAYQGFPPDVPAPWREYKFWQNSDAGRVPGVSGNVDTDIFYGDMAAFRSLTGSNVVETKVTTTPDPLDAAVSTIGYLSHDVADALQTAIDSAQAAINTLRRGGA